MRISLLVLPVALSATLAHAQGAAPAKPATPAAPAAKDAAKDAKAATPATPAAPATPATPAAPAAKPAPPAPAPELGAAMKAMEGNWKCTGEQKETQFAGPAHPIKAKITVKPDLGGFWYAMKYEEQKSKESPNPYTASMMVGYDPSSKKLVRSDMDSVGAITHFTSAGYEGDKMVWTGEGAMGPTKIQFRDTMTRKSAKEMQSVVEVGDGKGGWVVFVDQTCKK